VGLEVGEDPEEQEDVGVAKEEVVGSRGHDVTLPTLLQDLAQGADHLEVEAVAEE
jgi:hypothetical protein